MIPNWSYCSVAEFRTYLQGTSLSFDDDSQIGNDALLLRLAESASRKCEQVVQRVFAPTTQTIAYDLGRRDSRDDRLADPFHGRFPGAGDRGSGSGFSILEYDEFPDYWPNGWRSGRRVQLANWLLTPTAVTSYSDTSRSVTQVLTQGVSNDYVLRPSSGPPYRDLMLSERSNAYLGRGQEVLTVTGEWGWPYQLDSLGVLSAGMGSTDAALPLPNLPGVSPGQLLRIDAESIYVTTGFVLRRGVAGTTAAAHLINAPVSAVSYQSDLVETVLEIARLRYHSRGQGIASVTQDTTMAVVAYPGSEEKALCRRLDFFKSKSPKVRAF